MPQITMRQMLEAGVHFGHQTRYWNPKMAPYIFGARGKIHIINLEKTVPLFSDAMNFISGIAQKRGMILFVGTKRSARDACKEEAERCGMPYMTQRWLGGTLTNFATVKKSVQRLKELEAGETDGTFQKLVKHEVLGLRRERHADRHLKPPADMARLFRHHPDALAAVEAIVERCTFSLRDLTYHYPDEEVIPGKTAQDALATLAWNGLRQRFGAHPPRAYVDLLNHELGLVARMDYAPYFLTVNSIVQFARSQEILCQGR